MSDWMNEPYCVKISEREGWRVLRDINGLPRKFDNRFAANDWANQYGGYVKLYPYYPEYAAEERQYLLKQMDKEAKSFIQTQEAHDQKMAVMVRQLTNIPA